MGDWGFWEYYKEVYYCRCLLIFICKGGIKVLYYIDGKEDCEIKSLVIGIDYFFWVVGKMGFYWFFFWNFIGYCDCFWLFFGI